MKRFIVEEGSNSGHCCYVSSVIDMECPLKNDDGDIFGYRCVAETFITADADKIALLLNKDFK